MGGCDRRCLGIFALPALLLPQRVKLSIPFRVLVGLILGMLLGRYLALAYPQQLRSAGTQIGLSSSLPNAAQPESKSRTDFP